uniref:Large ribosomal subunit protein mL53 n=1 Tax=Tetradesmus obliquus TaxID=3088 RepID=A0A383VCI6_TETOB|eukprot:jgi/Sobl393_1/9043/SZX62489.1
MLKHLKRVFIQFHPSDARATPARELLARVGNDKARKSNPDCVVDYKVVETAQIPRSFIELQFADNEQHKLYTADLKVADIVKLIEQKATEMELRGVMKDVNFDPYSSQSTGKAAAPAAAAAAAGGKR